jgi:hypothetical protein
MRRRAFDSRLAVIEDIDSLCEYLVKNGIADKETARLAMELNDIWNYGFYQRRNAGREIKIFPTGFLSYNFNRDKNRNERMDSIGTYMPSLTAKDIIEWPSNGSTIDDRRNSLLCYSYGIGFSAAFAKPLSRFHQLDGSVSVTGVMETKKDTGSALYPRSANDHYAYSLTYPKADGQVRLTYSYFPTIRTRVSLDNQYFYTKEFHYRLKRQVIDTIVGLPSPIVHTFVAEQLVSSLSLEYYFSPRCSYSIGVHGGYFHYVNKDYHQLPFSAEHLYTNRREMTFGISAYLTYAIY